MMQFGGYDYNEKLNWLRNWSQGGLQIHEKSVAPAVEVYPKPFSGG